MEMDRRSRSIESPRRHRVHRDQRRYSRSRSRSRNRSREHERRRRTRSPPPMPRSHSRERYSRRSPEHDLYRELIYDDYNHHQDERMMHHEGRGMGRNIDEHDAHYMEERFHQERYEELREKEFRAHRNGGGPIYVDNMDRHFEERHKSREYERDRERVDRERRDHRHHHTKRYHSAERDDNSDGYDGMSVNHELDFRYQSPNNTVILRGLAQHITEADICSDLLQCGLFATSIRLIRKRKTGSDLGASRGFAFVEFSTVEEAVRWMDLKQGSLMLHDHHRVAMHYSFSKERLNKDKPIADWYCAKCGIFNFKRRDKCFKCSASREESEKGGEGSDEVSNILTKKIMLRNLDVLTNEEGVLTKMQELVPDLVSKISKILVCRDPLTQTSRGICYLNFDNLVDSMNTHNALNGLEPPLQMDNREVLISYCVDSENRQISRGHNNIKVTQDVMANVATVVDPNTYQYTVSDVPRLAEYSASLYATTPAEQEHYLKYYTQYYMTEIAKGQFGNLPSVNQLGESQNSGAAVALSAMQRKQNKKKSIKTTATQAAADAATKAAIAAATVVPPKGNDDKQYPTPDVSLYQYEDTSGYYYDPTTGLYYDAHSQYYYNNETGAYLYWDQRKSTYVLATAAAAQAAVQNTLEETVIAEAPKPPEWDESKKEGKRDKPDKVKVAKKIVKDMEKWAKQLNQKKDMVYVATPQPILPQKSEEPAVKPLGSGYADIGFSILEKKDRPKLNEYASPSISALVPSYASDSDDHDDHLQHNQQQQQQKQQMQPQMESDYVDFQKLTCLLCKRAFQSQDILTKHLKMSNLHKENLQKYNMSRGVTDSDEQNALSYRDRAKERRVKYGESEPPPPNRSKERFEKELKHMAKSNKPRQQQTPAMPIGENNVGNRLLQKMGWSEGQGLGRKNQGRTKIIEADARSSTAGLGTKSGSFAPGDDYKSYIKRMMQSRYEQAEIK